MVGRRMPALRGWGSAECGARSGWDGTAEDAEGRGEDEQSTALQTRFVYLCEQKNAAEKQGSDSRERERIVGLAKTSRLRFQKWSNQRQNCKSKDSTDKGIE